MPVRTIILDCWDNAEIKVAEFRLKSFPFHFHDTFSIGMVTEGTEVLILRGRELVISPGTIVIIPPGLPHAHRHADEFSWKYKCIYINTEVIRTFSKRTGLSISAETVTLLQNDAVAKCLHCLGENAGKNNLFAHLHEALQAHPQTKQDLTFAGEHQEITDELTEKFRRQPQASYTLEQIAATYNIDKYRLIRVFRSNTGLTPHQCLMMYRVFKAKTLILTGHPLSQVALDCGFFDQSHFTKCFIKFNGLSPEQFRLSVTKIN